MDGSDSERQAEATREQILRHAKELFAHYGFWKTNVGDIAERCAMSPGNLYRYFRNKQAIGLAVVVKFFEMSEAAMTAGLILPTGTPEERIRTMIRSGVGHLVAAMCENPRIVELADFLCSEPDGIALLQQHIAWKRDRIAAEIARGIEQGAFRDADPQATAAAVLTATKAFWMPHALAQWKDPESILPELDMVLDLIFAGLCRPGV
jgi:AcrR family transcriptional regulator